MNQETPLQRTGRMAISGILLYYLFKKLLKDASKSEAENQADTNPAVRQAMIFNSAMNPSGISWMRSMDATDVKTIEQTAAGVTNLDELQTAYNKLYDRDLLQDLEKELSPSDYTRILNILSSNSVKDGKPANPYVAAKALIAVKKAVFLRKTPDASYHDAWYESSAGNNIIRKAEPGEFIGYATGNQQYDAKNNVKFIQVGYAIDATNGPEWTKSRNKQKVMYWVSASSEYIDSFPYYKNLFDKYPASPNQTKWKRPLDYFEAKPLKGIPGDLLVSIRPAEILDEKLRPGRWADKGLILGRLLMQMDTGTGNRLLQFETADGHIRWTDQRFVRIQHFD